MVRLPRWSDRSLRPCSSYAFSLAELPGSDTEPSRDEIPSRDHPSQESPPVQAIEPGRRPIDDLRRWIEGHRSGVRAWSVEHRHQLLWGAPAHLPAILAHSLEPEVHLCFVLAAENGQDATAIECEHLDVVCGDRKSVV